MRRLRIIAVATSVIGLTSGCVTMVDGTPKAAPEQAPAPSVPPTAPPTTPAAGDLDVTRLNSLLLSVDDVRAIVEAPDLQIEEAYEQMPPSTVGYSPETCASAAYNTVEAGYRDSGFAAIFGMVMQEPAGTTLLHVVDEGVVAFPGGAAATDYVTKTVDGWRQCAKTSFTANRPESIERWTFGEVSENDGVSAIPKMSEDSPGWSCSHAITARANVVIDVAACGFSITDEATAIATRIRDKFPA